MLKKHLIYILTLLILHSCRSDEDFGRVVPDKRALTSTFIGMVDTISIHKIATTDPLTATVESDWMRVEILGDTAIRIEIDLNTGSASRKSEITINSGRASEIISVFQQKDPGGCPFQTIDSLALVALYNETNGENWYFAGDKDPTSKHIRWDFNKPITSWVGIYCIKLDGQHRVSSIDLSGRGAEGKLPEGLKTMTSLVNFMAPSNFFDIQALETLCELNDMQYIDLSYNRLEGEIPATLSKLDKLNMLILDGNIIKGDLPADFGNLSALQYLSMASNQMEINLERLRYNLALFHIDLSDNKISGVVPEFLSNMSNIDYINLSGNNLSGGLPIGISSLKKLETLILAGNNIVGSIPSQYGNLQQLQTLNLSANKLSKVEDNAITSPKLQHLNLSFNQIKTIGTGFEQLIALEVMELHNNQIQNIDSHFGRLTLLNTLNLSDNKLTKLPDGIGAMPSLELLIASNNLITTLPDLSTNKALTMVNLSNNQMTGSLPTWLGITKIRNLDLSNNNLTGTLPANVTSNRDLRTFCLSGNKLSGELPTQVLNDVRFKGRYEAVQQENPPYEWITIFISPIWNPVTDICPQQSGYEFSNCGHSTHAPENGGY